MRWWNKKRKSTEKCRKVNATFPEAPDFWSRGENLKNHPSDASGVETREVSSPSSKWKLRSDKILFTCPGNNKSKVKKPNLSYLDSF